MNNYRTDKVEAVCRLAGTMSEDEIASTIGLSVPSVRNIAWSNGVSLSYFHSYWTHQEVQTMLDMRKDGKTFVEIATTINRPSEAVQKKYATVKREIYERPRRNQKTVDAITMMAGHFNLNEIAEAVHRTPETVKVIASRLGISLRVNGRKARWSVEDDVYLLEELKSGASFDEIGAKLCRTPGACQARYRRIRR